VTCNDEVAELRRLAHDLRNELFALKLAPPAVRDADSTLQREQRLRDWLVVTEKRLAALGGSAG
jgi:hypothetical protein